MKKPTLCRAPQKCSECNAYVTKDDSTYTESGYDDNYYEVCAFGHYKASDKNELEMYHYRMKQFKEEIK